MKTLKLLIKSSFFDKINDFMCLVLMCNSSQTKSMFC